MNKLKYVLCLGIVALHADYNNHISKSDAKRYLNDSSISVSEVQHWLIVLNRIGSGYWSRENNNGRRTPSLIKYYNDNTSNEWRLSKLVQLDTGAEDMESLIKDYIKKHQTEWQDASSHSSNPIEWNVYTTLGYKLVREAKGIEDVVPR